MYVPFLAGVVVLPDWSFKQLTCVSLSYFTIFKCSHYGIYYQNPPSAIADSNVLVDNQVNVYLKVIEPSPLLHEVVNKRETVSNSIIVGRSTTFDCNYDVKPSDFNFIKAGTIGAYGAGFNENGMVGVSWANFIGGDNKAPKKPW